MAVEHGSEVLVEYKESRRLFKLKDTLCDDIAMYLDGLGAKNAKIYLGEPETARLATSIPFALQKWNDIWQTFIDVTSLADISPGSKVFVVKRHVEPPNKVGTDALQYHYIMYCQSSS